MSVVSIDGLVVALVCRWLLLGRRKSKSGKERTGKGNKNQQKHTRRTQTQVLEGSSQSDVTVEDVTSLSRESKHSKTVHVVGHCQKLFQ